MFGQPESQATFFRGDEASGALEETMLDKYRVSTLAVFECEAFLTRLDDLPDF